MSEAVLLIQALDSTRPGREKTLRPLISLLLVLSMIFGAGALARAQQIGLEPGLMDPVGPSADYITLRTDDLMVGFFSLFSGNNSGINHLVSYEVDDQNKLFTQPFQTLSTGVFGLGNSVSASGRILGRSRHLTAINWSVWGAARTVVR